MNSLRRAVFLAGATLLAALSLAIAGCAPPFIEALDKAAPLTRQMTTVGTIGSISLGNSQTNPRFLPTKPTATSLGPNDVQTGFLIQGSGNYEYLSFLYADSSGQTQNSSSQAFSLAGADPNYPLYQYEVAATTSTANIVVYNFNPTTPGSSTAELLTATPSTGSLVLTSGPVTLTTLTLNGLFIVGSQTTPAPNGGPDTFHWLDFDGANFAEVPDTLSGGATVFTSLAAQITGALVPAQNRYLYYNNASFSYAASFSGGKWICYQWPPIPSTPVILPGITHRIDALLSTGDLLSTDSGELTLYDPNGNQLFSVPSGGLQFCYEAYLGSTPYVFFSLPMQVSHGDWLFNVYAVPASSMRSLGG